LTVLSNLDTAERKAARKKGITRSSKIFKTIIAALQEKKANHIVSIDLKRVTEAVADFFVVCEAQSTTQVKALADGVEEAVRKATEERPYRVEGKQVAHWVLVDYVDIVVHIMQPDARKFYKLEEMWSDGELKEHLD
jgi:ribosome-associated protein